LESDAKTDVASLCACGRPGKHLDKSLCHACYEYRRKRRQLPASLTPRERFFAKVDVGSAGGCWLWTGYVSANGYGWFRTGRRLHAAHRWLFEIERGIVAPWLDLDHLCRVRNCVNPDHLEPVTRSENNRRGYVSRGRADFCPYGHPREVAGKQCSQCQREKYARRAADPEWRRQRAAYERHRKNSVHRVAEVSDEQREQEARRVGERE